MSVLRVTPDFVAWLSEQGLTLDDLRSPPIAWGYVALYERARAEPSQATPERSAEA